MVSSLARHAAIYPLALALLAVICTVCLPGIAFESSLVQDPVQSVQVVLAVFVPASLTLSGLLLRSVQRPRLPFPLLFFRGLSGLVAGTAAFHVIAILFGAPINILVGRTFVWAAIQAALVTMPACQALGFDGDKWRRCFARSEFRGPAETLICAPALASVAGSWAGAIPIPLDWDRPWQAWPVTCIVGALVGYATGAIVAAAIVLHAGQVAEDGARNKRM